MPREALLARTLVELADNLVEEFDIVELLTLLCDRCVEVLDVAAAGLMLASPAGDLAVMAYSSHAMRLLEIFELETHEGPCVDSFHTGVPVINQDLAAAEAEQRWPRVAVRARRAGFESVHALPMRLRGTTIGALNLFRTGTGHLGDADVVAGQALTDVATITILQHRASLEAHVLNDQLTQRAVEPSDHRAGQRCAGRSRESRHAGGLRAAAELRPHQQPPAHRCRPFSRRPRSRSRRDWVRVASTGSRPTGAESSWCGRPCRRSRRVRRGQVVDVCRMDDADWCVR